LGIMYGIRHELEISPRPKSTGNETVRGTVSILQNRNLTPGGFPYFIRANPG
jgi:hypothetical protein